MSYVALREAGNNGANIHNEPSPYDAVPAAVGKGSYVPFRGDTAAAPWPVP